MSYQALYRAWRPRKFCELYGQDAIKTTLRRQVAVGHAAHAYLFTGTRGTGKTSAAKILARAINCLSPEDGEPCGKCDACTSILSDTSMDVLEIDAASNNGVDEIRELRDKVRFPPSQLKYKVYIIDEVHMLSTGAFNALLKTLEEPPAHAVFILATTEPERLPSTILSRCQRFDFHRIHSKTIVARLREVLAGVGGKATEDALGEIAEAAEGSMRDALSLLDVCLAFAEDAVDSELVRDVLGGASRQSMFEFSDAIIRGDAASAISLIDRAIRCGCDPQVFCRDVAEQLRRIMLAGCVKSGLADILECTEEDAARYAEQAGRSQPILIQHALDLFIAAEPDMKWASRPRTALELAAVRSCSPVSEPDAAMEVRLAQVERAVKNGVVPATRASTSEKAEAPQAQKPRKSKSAPKKTPPSQPLQAPPDEYLKGIELLSENPALKQVLSFVQFFGFDGQVLSMGFDSGHIIYEKLLERRRAELEKTFSEAFGFPVSVNLQASAPEVREVQTSRKARETISASYDMFGRENIELTD